MASGASKAYFQETWFALLFLSACFGVGYLLFHYCMPPVNMSTNAVQTVAMAKLFAENRFLDAFSRFNQPPIYALLLSGIIRLEHTTELPRLIHGFHQLNLALYFVSIALVHFFISRHIKKPYTFIITALYAIAPSTLEMAWDIGPYMAYMVISLGALYAVDYSLSQASAMAGQITRGELVLCGSLLAAGILTHQVGYLVVIAFFFVMLKRFGLKHSATVLAALILIISPFIGRDIFYVFRKPSLYVAPSASLIQAATDRGIFKTLQSYADQTLFSVTHHAVGDLQLASLNNLTDSNITNTNRIGITQQPWGRWTIGILALIGAIYGLYQYTGIGTLYLATYIITAFILLPQSGLLLAPVLPLILLYIYYGIVRTGEWMKRLHLPLAKLATPALTAWILLCTLTTYLSESKEIQTTQAARQPKVIYMNTAQAPETRLETAQANAAHHRAMDWLKAHTGNPTQTTLATRPEAASTVASTQSTGSSPSLSKASNHDFLVEENASTISALHKGKKAQAKGLNLVYEDIPGRIRIWQVKPAAH